MQRVALYYFELNTSNLSCMSPMREENLLVEAVDYRQERVGKRGRGRERGFLVYVYDLADNASGIILLSNLNWRAILLISG